MVAAYAAQQLDSSDGLQRLGPFNPKYIYLRAEATGHPPAFLVLGYIDPHPQGDIEVWYSATQEVIKTQNGRIVATAGLEIDWRKVQFPTMPPTWAHPPLQDVRYQRLRDVMPGYRYAIHDDVAFQAWPGMPSIHLPVSLKVAQARTYTWFRETTLNTTHDGPPLPPAWYAWGTHRGTPMVVYSEQCLSATYCLRLQRWPVQEAAL